MTGRVTMLGISRWSGQGRSYRTLQRFFATALPWAALFWLFFRIHLWSIQPAPLVPTLDPRFGRKCGRSTFSRCRLDVVAFTAIPKEPECLVEARKMGVTEGHVNRLKMIKRTAYGRA